MKISIKTKLFFSLGAVIIFFMMTLLFSHLAFYGPYVVWQNSNLLANTYESVSKQIITNGGYLFKNIEDFETANGMHMTFINDDLNNVSSFEVSESGEIKQKITDNREAIQYESVIAERQLDIIANSYIIYTQKNEKSHSKFLTLIGYIPLKQNLLYMVLSIPIPSIEKNVEYSRFFIFTTAIITLVFSMLIAFLISRQFVKPILKIENITKRMAKLDFSHKYKGETSDEIGELGENINLLSEKLEDSIKELTQTNAKLEEEIKKERQIDEMRQNLIANISHDLKTPIAIIQGYAEGLQEDIFTTKEDRDFYTSVIIDESERMNKLVKQILSLSQLEMGKIKPEPEDIEIKSFTDTVINKFTLIAQEKEIILENLTEETCICADGNMLSQVLVNLLTNAIDHTERQNTITVSSEIKADDNKLRIKIHNPGETIPEDEMEKIWLSFYKRDKARSVKYGGTGIGLTIVKIILEAHNNLCGVFNTEDGVTFWFEFDLSKPEDIESPNDTNDLENIN